MSTPYTHTQNVRVTAEQKADIDNRGGSTYVRGIIDIFKEVEEDHIKFLNGKGGSAYLRELIEWDIECDKKARTATE